MRIRVGHLLYEICPLGVEEADERNIDGMCEHHTQRILIREELPPAQQAGVLIHELIHAMFHVYAMPRRGITEEQVAAGLEGPVAILLRDNPDIGTAIRQALDAGVPLVTEQR